MVFLVLSEEEKNYRLYTDDITFVKLGIVAGYESCEFYSCQ